MTCGSGLLQLGLIVSCGPGSALVAFSSVDSPAYHFALPTGTLSLLSSPFWPCPGQLTFFFPCITQPGPYPFLPIPYSFPSLSLSVRTARRRHLPRRGSGWPGWQTWPGLRQAWPGRQADGQAGLACPCLPMPCLPFPLPSMAACPSPSLPLLPHLPPWHPGICCLLSLAFDPRQWGGLWA